MLLFEETGGSANANNYNTIIGDGLVGRAGHMSHSFHRSSSCKSRAQRLRSHGKEPRGGEPAKLAGFFRLLYTFVIQVQLCQPQGWIGESFPPTSRCVSERQLSYVEANIVRIRFFGWNVAEDCMHSFIVFCPLPQILILLPQTAVRNVTYLN